MNHCYRFEPPPKLGPFERPKASGKLPEVNKVITGVPLVGIATPAMKYANEETESVDLAVLKKTEVPYAFDSSGRKPKIDVELKHLGVLD